MNTTSEVDLKKSLQTLYIAGQFPEAIALIEREYKDKEISAFALEILKSFKEINELPLEIEPIPYESLEAQIDHRLNHNQIEDFKKLFESELELTAKGLTEAEKKEILARWEYLLTLPFAKKALGKNWCYGYLKLSIWKIGDVHKEIFSTIHALDIPKIISTVHTIVPYLCMLIRETDVSERAKRVGKLFQHAYDQYFVHYISGRLPFLCRSNIEKLLGMEGRPNKEVEEAKAGFVHDQIEAVKKLGEGKKHFIIGGWTFKDAKHLVGYLIEKKREAFSFSVIDSSEDHGVQMMVRPPVIQRTPWRRRINPFFTLNGIKAENMFNPAFFERIYKATIGLEVLENAQRFIAGIANVLDVSIEDSIDRSQPFNYGIQQGPTCRWKMFNMALKGIIDSERAEGEDNSKQTMKLLKRKNISLMGENLANSKQYDLAREEELKASLRTLYHANQFSEALALIEREYKDKEISDFGLRVLGPFQEINEQPLEIKPRSYENPEAQIEHHLMHNQTSAFRELFEPELKIAVKDLTETEMREIFERWEYMLTLPFSRSAVGKIWCYTYLKLSIWKIPEVHDEVFTTIRALRVPETSATVPMIVPYLCMLIRDTDVSRTAKQVGELFKRAYDQYLNHYISGMLSFVCRSFIEKHLEVEGRPNKEFEEAKARFIQDQIEAIKSLGENGKHFIIGEWTLENRGHTVGYLIEKKGETFSFSIIDSHQDLGVLMGVRSPVIQKKPWRKHINPFFTLNGIKAENMTKHAFFDRIYKATIGLEHLENEQSFIAGIADVLDVSVEDSIDRFQPFNYAIQEGDTCHWKTFNMALKGMIDSERAEGEDNSKQTMDLLKDKNSALMWERSESARRLRAPSSPI